MRDTPIITFINKLDRDGRDPFDLLMDIEQPEDPVRADDLADWHGQAVPRHLQLVSQRAAAVFGHRIGTGAGRWCITARKIPRSMTCSEPRSDTCDGSGTIDARRRDAV